MKANVLQLWKVCFEGNINFWIFYVYIFLNYLFSLDFIGKNYYGTLTAGDSSDLNVGGVTETNNMISGVSGCKGEAVVQPRFKRGDIM